MRTIYKIAKAELQNLFYSPVAWLILIVFAILTAMSFTGVISNLLRSQDQGYSLWSATFGTFAGWGALFPTVQQYLYLFIPLLTMGLMSREYASGSIKLLYSSPITNTQIILGKYLSVMVYGLALIGILVLYVIFAGVTYIHFDLPHVLCGLLGLYLLLCAYGAIGLFMSTITSYQVVAVVGTLGVLALLNFVGKIGQDIEFIRDITYWLSIQGRCSEFVNGLICSEDVLYFLIIIVMFLMFSVMKLQSERRKSTGWAIAGKYAGVFCCAMLAGYFSSRPMLMCYYDTTATKYQTLTPNSQDIIARAEGGMTITTYANLLEPNVFLGLPQNVNNDLLSFKKYRRFKPEIKFKYVYYWDKAKDPDLDLLFPNLTDEERAKSRAFSWNLKLDMFLTPEQIKQKIDLSPEGNRFVRLIERESGEKTFLRIFDDMQRYPGEPEISAAIKRLVMKLPKVGFLTGHGERDCNREGDREYIRISQDKPFRFALINQGFDFEEVNLSRPIPEDVSIVVIAEMKEPMTEAETANLKQYIDRGGNLLLAGEPKRQEFMNPVAALFGVEFLPGRIVKLSEEFQPDLQFVTPTEECSQVNHVFKNLWRRRPKSCLAMPGTTGVRVVEDKGFKATQMFVTDTLGGCWNELQTTDFIDDMPVMDVAAGEKEERFCTVMALSRPFGDREQRILVLGDADCISNSELSIVRKDIPAQNFSLVHGGFYWLSNDEAPVNVERPNQKDTKIKYLTGPSFFTWKVVFIAVIPALMLVAILLIWIRRRGR